LKKYKEDVYNQKILEYSASGNISKLKEVLEKSNIIHINAIRGKRLNIDALKATAAHLRSYQPDFNWSPAMYASACGQKDILRYYFNVLKVNPRQALILNT
jgi:hypothetical protein